MFVLLILFVLLVMLYALCAFTEFPGLSHLRNIWIETAMTTADHQWLATSFFPKSVVEKVMSNYVEDLGIITVTNIEKTDEDRIYEAVLKKYQSDNKKNEAEEKGVQTTDFIETDKQIEEKENIVALQHDVPYKDVFGNTVVVDDYSEGISIVEISTTTYFGRLVIVDDPSRVVVKNTDKRGQRGKLILDYLSDYNAIIGINANGFADPEGHGMGGDILGYSISDGEVWGNGDKSHYVTIGFDTEDRLVVGKFSDFEKYNLRDAVQYMPLLIADGEILENTKSGWGMQPRTLVGQRQDGAVLLFVVDGRQVGYSIGITMYEAAEVLQQYGAVTAAACDGGSSSTLAYNGEIINKPSTPMKTGRYLPNAILVLRKNEE